MDRIRLTWCKIWEMLKQNFIGVGLHSNIQIALYAIDQLKQLSIKFLQVFVVVVMVGRNKSSHNSTSRRISWSPSRSSFKSRNTTKSKSTSCRASPCSRNAATTTSSRAGSTLCIHHTHRVIISIILRALDEEVKTFTELSVQVYINV